ncbi:MAG: metal ABC transporter permease [Desulfobulbaceae bacterium]
MYRFLTDLQQFEFLRHALLTGVLASIACGIIGSYVTVRRTTYIAGAIAHCTLGGMGIAGYLAKEQGMTWFTPLLGAVCAALLAALVISWVRATGTARLDTILSAVWAIGMAVGIIFISRTSGYNEDLMSYLFGDILMVSRQDMVIIGLLDLVVLAGFFLFYNKLVAISFDEEFARITGIRVDLYNTLFLCLVALTVVLLVQVVGIILVVALLALPAAAAGQLTRRLPPMMFLAVFLSLASTSGGLALSYGPDLPAGATIILIAGGLYIASLMLSRLVSLRTR